jgi:uncharacterized membrane protein
MRWLFSNPARIDHKRVTAAIAEAEKTTSGEIRVLIARHKTQNPVAAAQRHFNNLGLGLEGHLNAVLIFVSPRSRNFAVIGDKGVHEKCGDGFWTELASAMGGYFKRGEFTEGLVHGIGRAGALLSEHFPKGERSK